jgi:uncharacterized protein (DUF427 family)
LGSAERREHQIAHRAGRDVERIEKEQSMSAGPGYKKHPEHRVATKPAGVRVQVRFNGELIADTQDAIALEESGYGVVYYLPRGDVKMERLSRTSQRTHCPFKGDASYFTLSNGTTAENAVWSYEQPYDEVSVIRDRLAFYPDRVDSITAVPR